ncbi:LacI family DNA-binding transcriptional regulator [Bacillaceae bacterium S4-13-58]
MATITMKEISRILGVSTATVSRVLNNSGGYSEGTKKRVLDVLEKYNYQTNVVAKSLRTRQSKTVGVVVPDITNEYFASIALAVENFFVPYGYSIFIYNTSANIEKERLLLRDIVSRGVDGLIYISGNPDVPLEAHKNNIPVVCINRHKQLNSEISVVESDNFQGGYIATEELLKQGCKRILMIRDKRDIIPQNERFKGYRKALADHDIPFEKLLVQEITFDAFHSAKCVNELISASVSFDGIFASSDILAIGSLKALRENQIPIPADVKVVGFDNNSFGEHSYPPLTTINQDKTQLGESASRLLLDLMEKEMKDKRMEIVLPVNLVKRDTTF